MKHSLDPQRLQGLPVTSSSRKFASSCFDCLSAGPVKQIGLFPPSPVADGQSKQLSGTARKEP